MWTSEDFNAEGAKDFAEASESVRRKPEVLSASSYHPFSRRIVALCFILALAFSVRALTANFLRAHLDDPGWFPSGIYGAFDQQAQDWLDHRASIFWIDDPSRTDRATYAPGYPLWLAFIYTLSGSRSPVTVQNVQWVLDSFAVLLIVGVGVTAFDWRVGLWAGGIAALWPLLASHGSVPLADAPTSWIVIGAIWMLLLAAKRKRLRWAIGAGALVGLSCWLRANAMLLMFMWGLALLLIVPATWRLRMLLSAGLVLSALLVIAPIVVRNGIAFHALVPTGLGMGTNLWEGIGESERGRTEFGAVSTDAEVIEQERAQLNLPREAPLGLYYPDGIRRDRERMRKSLSVILRHPFWFTGTVGRRMIAVVNFAGTPMGDYGSAGFNVTSKKCLPPQLQIGLLAWPVNLLGMFQSVLRYFLIPLILMGIIVASRLDKRVTAILIVTVFYYWVVNSIMHTNIRYGLPMHAIFTVFAGLAICRLVDLAFRRLPSASDRS